MARLRSEKSKEAEKLYRKGEKLVDIAAKLNAPEGTVRRWKSEQRWADRLDADTKKKLTERSVIETNGNIPNARKPGPPKGSRNAAGHGAPKGNKNNFKNGLYEEIYWDSLDETEREMIALMKFDDEEQQLIEQIQLITVRERRLMSRIEQWKNTNGGLAVDSVTKRNSETRGDVFTNEVETTTRTVATFELISRLESELTRVQGRKTRCIEALGKLRLERRKLEDTSRGNAIANEWIAAIIGDSEFGSEGDDGQ